MPGLSIAIIVIIATIVILAIIIIPPLLLTKIFKINQNHILSGLVFLWKSCWIYFAVILFKGGSLRYGYNQDYRYHLHDLPFLLLSIVIPVFVWPLLPYTEREGIYHAIKSRKMNFKLSLILWSCIYFLIFMLLYDFAHKYHYTNQYGYTGKQMLFYYLIILPYFSFGPFVTFLVVLLLGWFLRIELTRRKWPNLLISGVCAFVPFLLYSNFLFLNVILPKVYSLMDDILCLFSCT